MKIITHTHTGFSIFQTALQRLDDCTCVCALHSSDVTNALRAPLGASVPQYALHGHFPHTHRLLSKINNWSLLPAITLHFFLSVFQILWYSHVILFNFFVLQLEDWWDFSTFWSFSCTEEHSNEKLSFRMMDLKKSIAVLFIRKVRKAFQTWSLSESHVHISSCLKCAELFLNGWRFSQRMWLLWSNSEGLLSFLLFKV